MSVSFSNKNTVITITSGTIIRAFFIFVLVVILYTLRDLVAVVLFAVVIASGVEPATQWLVRRRIPRTLSVIMVYLGGFIFIGGIFYLLIPPLFNDLSDFITLAPIYLDKAFGLQGAGKVFPNLPHFISNSLIDIATYLKTTIETFTGGFFKSVASVFGGAVSFVLLIVLSFYMSVQEKGVEIFLRVITPATREKYVLDLWRRAQNKIAIWVKGQILLGVLVGVLTFLGLLILKVDYPFPLALLAGLFELIPLFGPILSAIPAIAIAILQSPILAVYVIILYVIIQQFENHLIYPLVVRRSIGVSPIIVILALIIGGRLGGFFGLLLAVPMATVIMEFVNDVETKKRMASENGV